MEVLITDAEKQHLSQLEEIEKACFSVPWTLEQLRSQLKDERHECVCALDM